MKNRTIISIVIVTVLVICIFGANTFAIAIPTTSPQVSAVNVSYSGGANAIVSGNAACSKVLIVIVDSNGNQIALDDAAVSSGAFNKTVNTGVLQSNVTYTAKVCDIYGDSGYTKKDFSYTPSTPPPSTPPPLTPPPSTTESSITPTGSGIDTTTGGSTSGSDTGTTGSTEVSNSDGTVTGTTSTTATVDKATGTATAQVTEEQVTAAVTKAIEEASKQADNTNTQVEIKIDSSNDAKQVSLELPKTALDTIAQSDVDALKVNTVVGDMTLDQKTLDTIKSAAASQSSDATVSISVAKVDTSAVLSSYSGDTKQEIQDKIGDRPVYDFNIQVGDTKVSDFQGGKVDISLPYTPREGEDVNAIVIYYIADDGTLKCIPNCHYDPVTKSVAFELAHFSKYAVAYNAISFSDVAANAWYNKPVTYIAARSVINGSGGNFAPLKDVSRADFLIMVMRAYGIELDKNISDNFADAGNKYYTAYLGTAKRLGLVTGSNNKFAPEVSVSRQDMFVILYRALGKLGKLPEGSNGKSFTSYGDTQSIADYAKAAMKLFTETGITTGDGKNLNPKATSTRAQAAQVLYNLLTI